ncbi:MAG: tyrosine-type recombinase/integrase [Ignavibacteria bacterium]|jgi:integrase/recombinase XerD
MDQYLIEAFIGLFLTGCRIEEFSSLKWKDSIDIRNKLIMIRTYDEFETKTYSSERDIPMSNLLHKLLISKQARSNSEYVFSNAKGKSLTERSMLRRCKEIAKEAGITKNATLHKWRHTYSTFLKKNDVDYTDRQYLLGHKPDSVTDHYTKVDPLNLHSKISQLDKYLPEKIVKEILEMKLRTKINIHKKLLQKR